MKTSLKGYDTWGVPGDEDVDNVDDELGERTVGGDTLTEPIKELYPVESDTTVDATFKNKQPDKQEYYNQFTATKIWEDKGLENFRPSTEDFENLLTLSRTAPAQGGDGGASGWTDTLEEGTDYTLTFVPTDGAESNIWTIVIEPTGNGFEKYAPNGMAWKYELKEKESEKTGRLQINNNDDYPANQRYTTTKTN